MKDDAKRIAAYIAKTTPTTVGLKVAEMLTGMKSNFSAAATAWVDRETMVQGILNSKSVQPVQYPFYLNFAREMLKREVAGLDGDSMVAWATVICAKYVGYGLTEAILQDIAQDAFGVTIP